MTRRKEKLTLLVDDRVADRIRKAVRDGAASSQSALVQEAVTLYLAAKERDALRRAYADAAQDPDFIEDVEAVRRDFRYADVDPELEIPS